MRLFFHGPDHAVYKLAEMKERLYSGRAQDLRASEGLIPGARCSCGSTTRRTETRKVCGDCGARWPKSNPRTCPKGHPAAIWISFEACRRCDLVWPTEPAFIPRGLIEGGRRNTAIEDLLTDLATLDSMVSRLTLWERRVYLLHLFGEHHGGQDALVHRCRQLWPRRAQRWTRDGVRALVAAARDRLRDQLRRAGMLMEAA